MYVQCVIKSVRGDTAGGTWEGRYWSCTALYYVHAMGD